MKYPNNISCRLRHVKLEREENRVRALLTTIGLSNDKLGCRVWEVSIIYKGTC